MKDCSKKEEIKMQVPGMKLVRKIPGSKRKCGGECRLYVTKELCNLYSAISIVK
jgi:hypothetical protein